MKVFIPNSFEILIITSIILALTISLGYLFTQIKKYSTSIILAWVYLVSITTIVERLCSNQPPGFRMLSIILVMLFSMKIIVTVEYYKYKQNKLSFIKWIVFVVGWFGMKPNLFEELGTKPKEGSRSLILFGLGRICIGSILLLIAHYLISTSDTFKLILIIAFSLAGLSLVLHFGVLNISAGIWRLFGVDTRMLFKSPLLSTSLTEFWGKRWNIAFSEMTAIAIYRPLKNIFGGTVATLIAFLFSGLLHEMAISVPVKAGIGLPLLYFLIHGIVMLAERELAKRGILIGKNKWVGRGWVIFWLLLPMPLLFHKYFLKGIVLPIIGY